MNTIGYDNWKLQESPSNESEDIEYISVEFIEDGEDLKAFIYEKNGNDLEYDFDRLDSILDCELDDNNDVVFCLDENKVINYAYNNL